MQRLGAGVQQDEAGTGGTSAERIVMLTDAVVAIAMTLLVLPLVDLAPEADRAPLGTFLRTHGSELFGFVLSFLVIAQFWAAHERTFTGLRQASSAMRVLNMFWLLGIAFLPFPTAVVGRHTTNASAFFYIATMFALGVLTSVISQLALHQLPEQASMSGLHRHVRLSWAATAVFGVCAVISAWNADLGLWGLLLILVVRLADRAGSRLGGLRALMDRAGGRAEQ
jgi:uncharacterized membrane protein